jgi:hypothetical protein
VHEYSLNVGFVLAIEHYFFGNLTLFSLFLFIYLLLFLFLKEFLQNPGIDSIFLGMATTKSEKEDRIIVSDLRGKLQISHR